MSINRYRLSTTLTASSQSLIKLQFGDRLCIRNRIVQQPIIPGFRCQAIRLLKLQFRD